MIAGAPTITDAGKEKPTITCGVSPTARLAEAAAICPPRLDVAAPIGRLSTYAFAAVLETPKVNRHELKPATLAVVRFKVVAVLLAIPPQVPPPPVAVNVKPGGKVGRVIASVNADAVAALLLLIVTRICDSTPTATDAGTNTTATLNGGTMIAMLADTCGAAENPEPAAWSAVRLHDPKPTKVITPLDTVQMVAALVVAYTTALPDPPPDALNVNGAVPKATLDGGAKPLMAWGDRLTVMTTLAVTCVAGE